MASKLVVRRNQKKATILASKRTVEDAIRCADALGAGWMDANPNDPRIDELQRVVDHLSSLLTKTPQQMKQEGASSVEDYFDDSKPAGQQNAQTVKREVMQIAKWHDETRGQNAQPAQRTPEQSGVGYVPDNAVAEQGIHASQEKDMKKANGASFVTDRDEKGEPKAPEKLEVPRLAAKKKEAVPEAAPAPVPAPAAGSGSVNPIEYIPTETLIKVIEDMPKEEDFAQNKDKQDALIALTEILKARPVLAPEVPEGAAPAAPVAAPAAAPIPVAASKKKADLGDHAMGGGGTIGGGSGAGPNQGGSGGSNTPVATDGANPAPAAAPTKIDLGGLSLASSLEEEKTADDYKLHDFKLQDEGIVPSGRLPNMDDQESQMHPEEELHEASAPSPFAGLKAAIASLSAEVDKLASGAAGGAWSTDGDKGDVVESGGRTPEVAEAHAMRDDNTGIQHPATVEPIKLASGEMSTSKAVNKAESLGNDLKKMYLDAKGLTGVNDTRPVREAVEAIFRAADMFDEATKALNKQDQQEKSEAEAAEIKAKNKKSGSLGGLAFAAAE